MKRPTVLAVCGFSGLILVLAIIACGRALPEPQPVQLDLPLGLDPNLVYIPADNPLTDQKIALGKQLFFDKRLSADNTVACATCHSPRFGYTDGQPVATGIRGQQGGRSAPSAINRAFSRNQFWDGRADSLEAQAVGPIQAPIEMGLSHPDAVAKLKGIQGYVRQFESVFGTQDFTIDHVGMAIASYERTILSGNSPFDRFQAGDQGALSPAAQRGLALFNDKAGCASCHSGSNFTDEKYHNLGVGMDQPDPDPGRFSVTNREEDRGAFKTQTLRDIVQTAPYFHDGSARTLEEMVEFYNQGGFDNSNLSESIKPLDLTDEEKSDLVEFLRALTGEIDVDVMAPQLPK